MKTIPSRYKSIPLSTRFFLKARWKLTPYSQMVSRLPLQGRILDLGCGHGLFALAAALHGPERTVLGIDHDPNRIALGVCAAQDIPNIQLETGSLLQAYKKPESYSAVAMIDVMHYFNPEIQEKLIRQAYTLLPSGGTLLVREVDPQGGIPSVWNRLYEKVATTVGFTRIEKSTHHFRTRHDWEALLQKNGFKVQAERCSSFLFADILYICERTSL